MGSGESTGRKVSFGVDDEDRVRILRGVKLSEDVLQRMRGVANIAPGQSSPTAPSTQKAAGAGSNLLPQRAQPTTPPSTSKPTSPREEPKRYDQKHAEFKEELSKVAQSEREQIKTISRERRQKHQEAEKAKQLAQHLQKKDSQLKALDAFYKEQLAQLEKRNLERYEQSKDQFHQAASQSEGNVRSHNTDPVCLGLQAQILSCYRDNRDQTLRCSDLAKEYMQCINAAKKNLLVNHG